MELIIYYARKTFRKNPRDLSKTNVFQRINYGIFFLKNPWDLHGVLLNTLHKFPYICPFNFFRIKARNEG
ncbi:MAG: hypothetical protein C4543_05335 [Ignavibacteriales bacterium]|nr:MAG: hypothetical protein C4543_05335 [Ignavibacteriales bacterium]